MNFFASASAALLLAYGSVALVGCSQDTGTGSDLTSSSSSSAESTCVTQAQATATYEQRVHADDVALQASYDAAMAQDKEDLRLAKVALDEKLASLPNTNDSAELYNEAIVEYNKTIGADGPIIQAYNARVAAAQAQWNADVKAARDAYYASVLCP